MPYLEDISALYDIHEAERCPLTDSLTDFLCIQSINAFIAQTGNVIGVLSGTYISYIALIATFDNHT